MSLVEWKHPWRYRLTVRTEPSQGLNTGSIPVSATTNKRLTRTEVPPGATRGAPEKTAQNKWVHKTRRDFGLYAKLWARLACPGVPCRAVASWLLWAVAEVGCTIVSEA